MDKQEQSADEHGLRATLSLYWRAYGGWKAVVGSPFCWLSIALMALTCRFWLYQEWWDQVLSVMPNMLGFTLGGFAVFLGFGDEKFKNIISGQDPDHPAAPSPYMEISATFLHFVLVQLIALLLAVGAKATDFTLPGHWAELSRWLAQYRFIANALGYWFFLYGLCIVAATAIAIFRVAFWYDSYQTVMRDHDQAP